MKGVAKNSGFTLLWDVYILPLNRHTPPNRSQGILSEPKPLYQKCSSSCFWEKEHALYFTDMIFNPSLLGTYILANLILKLNFNFDSFKIGGNVIGKWW